MENPAVVHTDGSDFRVQAEINPCRQVRVRAYFVSVFVVSKFLARCHEDVAHPFDAGTVRAKDHRKAVP